MIYAVITICLANIAFFLFAVIQLTLLDKKIAKEYPKWYKR